MAIPLLVIQHESDKGLGVLEAPLRQAGAELDICLTDRDRIELAEHSGVIALPGTANPVDDTEAVSLTRSILARRSIGNCPFSASVSGPNFSPRLPAPRPFPVRRNGATGP